MMDASDEEKESLPSVLEGREELAPAAEPVPLAPVEEVAPTAEPVSGLELDQAAGEETI